MKLASRSLTLTSESLHSIFWENLDLGNRAPPSAIGNILNLFGKFGITIPPKPANISTPPISIELDISFSTYAKEITPSSCFKVMLAQRIETFQPELILFTDGSFDGILTAFAVTKQSSHNTFETIIANRLPDHAGIFTAELASITSAIKYGSEQNTKMLICTDSLSSLKAIMYNKRGIFNSLQLPHHPANATLLWVPAHIGIPGNEFADAAAKDALNLPEISDPPSYPGAIFTPYSAKKMEGDLALWNHGNVFLKEICSTGIRKNYNAHLSRSDCIFLARLRVNKALFNTNHYYNRTEILKCNFCGLAMSVRHILTECAASKVNAPISEVLDCTKIGMIPVIKSALRIHGICDV